MTTKRADIFNLSATLVSAWLKVPLNREGMLRRKPPTKIAVERAVFLAAYEGMKAWG